MAARWTISCKTVFNLTYCILWCTKFRRDILKDNVEARLRDLLTAKASEMGIEISSMEILPDRVKLLVKASPLISPHSIVQQFKGPTSRLLRNEFPRVKSRVPTLWTRGYYCATLGKESEKVIAQFVELQRNV